MGGRGGSSHRRTGGGLSSLTTTAQVSDWIRRQHWFRPYALVNLDGVDVVAAREIAAAYQQVFDRYPQLIGAFSGVKSFDLGNGVYADCNLQTGQIRVSDTMYRNAQALAVSTPRIFAQTGIRPVRIGRPLSPTRSDMPSTALSHRSWMWAAGHFTGIGIRTQPCCKRRWLTN